MTSPDAAVPLPTALWRAVAPRRADTRLLWSAAAALALSGTVHAAVWLASGEPWAGAVSWRKPVTFGWSFGVTLASLAWVLDHLPTRRHRWPLAVGLAVASLVEVGLVTVQRWRGVASHFNRATPFDDAVFDAMGASIAVVAVVTVVVLARSIRHLGLRSPVGIAAGAGMTLLLVAQGVGGRLIAVGEAATAATGTVPSAVTIGADGVGALPHAVGLHALQVLGGFAVVVGVGALTPARRRRLLWLATAGYGALFGWAAVQTTAGRTPSDLSALGAGLLAAAVVLLGSAAVGAVRGLRARTVAPAGPAATPAPQEQTAATVGP